MSADVVDVTFDSTGLMAGVYEGTLCVESNDPQNPLVEVAVAADWLRTIRQQLRWLT